LIDLVSNTNSPDVARGVDGQLFLIGGAQQVLAYVTGTIPVHPGVKQIVKENLSRRHMLCAEAGIRYVHMLCPDKHSVMPESFPYPIAVEVGREFQAACEGLFEYPIEALRAIKPNRGFMRTDTHWDAHGMIEFVRQTLLGLGFDPSVFVNSTNLIEALKTHQDGFCGDLGQKVTPRETESRLFLNRPSQTIFLSNNVLGNNGALYITINMAAPFERLLIFGDSFIISCLGLFSLFFKEIFLVRSPFFHLELLGLFQPTHVITSNVERYLPRMPTDREAPLALLMALLVKKELSPDEGFYEAANALLLQNTPFHDRFVARIAAR
jgi:hypothetical protein